MSRALIAAAVGLLGCAQPSSVRRGQLAPALAGEGAPPARTFAGEVVSLRTLRQRGPVLLVFLRGFS